MTVLLETCWIRSPPGNPPVRLPHGLPATSCKSAEDRLCVPGVGSDPSQGLAGPTFADQYFLGQPLTYFTVIRKLWLARAGEPQCVHLDAA